MHIHLLIMQIPPFSPVLPQLPCACATLRRTSRALTQTYAKHFRDSGMEVTQFTLLQALQRTGEITQRRLGEILVLDSTTLSRSLAPLHRNGWIAVRSGNDRREKRIALSASGEAQMQSALQGWNDAQTRLKKLLGEDEWTETMGAMERLTAAALVLEQNTETGASV